MSSGTAHKPHYGYIDCLRGYAVLMVMTSHYTYLFPNLPYPVHRLAVMGWYGVQLFFICSCVTLLMSWRYEEDTRGRADVRSFFIRRFFRIAPAYYLAAILYFFVASPEHGFNLVQALASMAFVNAWHPLLTPTVDDRWIVVPGGWSIGVEFTFYMLFPLFAASARSLRSAIVALIATILAGTVIDRWAFGALNSAYSHAAVENFLFFWFPNEASVFASGALVYFLVSKLNSGAGWLRHPTVWACVAIAGFFALAYVPLGNFLGATPLVPSSLAVCLPLSVFVLALSQSGGRLFVNKYTALVGKVSFSAYLLHFAVLTALEVLIPDRWLQAGRFEAIAVFVALWPLAAASTVAAAWCSYHAIELPGMALGKTLARRLRSRAVPA